MSLLITWEWMRFHFHLFYRKEEQKRAEDKDPGDTSMLVWTEGRISKGG